MHGALAVCLFVFHVSAYRWDTQAFTYVGTREHDGISYRRSGTNECRVCFAGKECLPFSPVECEYYIETSKILETDNGPDNPNADPQLRASVDSMIFSVVEKAKNEGENECLPYISKYTDCNKENVCLGCKTCECDGTGRWNCTIQQKCRPELIHLVADQKTLLAVIDNMKKGPEAIRLKRAIYHSVRSLEDMDAENNMDENHHNQDDYSEYQTQTVNMYPENTNALYDDDDNLKTANITPRNKELIKLIVNSLIHDTLPDIFNDNNLDFETNRVKRWISNTKSKVNSINTDTTTESNVDTTILVENDTNTLKNKITFEELSEWVHEMHPLINEGEVTQTAVEEASSYEVTTTDIAFKSTAANFPEYSNPEYIAFEEVYNNVQVDNKTYARRKPPLDHVTKYVDKDFNMYDDKYYEDGSTTTQKGTYAGNSIAEKMNQVASAGNAFYDSATVHNIQSPNEVVVDLLDTANVAGLDIQTENAQLNDIKIDKTDKLETINAANIMKRDVSSSATNEQDKSNSTITQMDTTKIANLSVNTKANDLVNNTSTTGSVSYLKDSVLDPLDNILENKQKEIREILRMRDHLVKFIQAHSDNSNLNISSKDVPVKLYKLEYIPHHHHDLNLRRTNLTMLDKYKLKLKRDVYEVIKDVVSIKKLYNASTKFPAELNFLIRSLKHYIHNIGFRPKGNIRNPRRNNNSGTASGTKSFIIKIFEVLVKYKHHSDALEPLSRYSKRMVKRFIKNNYIDDFAGTGLRIYDPHYNLTNDLRNVGTQWQILTSLIETSAAPDKLHNMKRLHLMMSVDIANMNDALALIDFARGRRMIPVDEADGEIIVMNINKNINKIKHKIQDAIHRRTALKPTQIEENVTVKHKGKDSFMSQIKRLLTNSKKDILRLLGRKVPKSDIVKQIARKNVEEMTKKKLQETMEKWQTNLNIISTREKRSNKDYDKINRRIKNIIPKYLRRKVPAAKGTKSKKGKALKKNPAAPKPVAHKKVEVKPTTKHPAKMVKAKIEKAKTEKANKAKIEKIKMTKAKIEKVTTNNAKLEKAKKEKVRKSKYEKVKTKRVKREASVTKVLADETEDVKSTTKLPAKMHEANIEKVINEKVKIVKTKKSKFVKSKKAKIEQSKKKRVKREVNEDQIDTAKEEKTKIVQIKKDKAVTEKSKKKKNKKRKAKMAIANFAKDSAKTKHTTAKSIVLRHPTPTPKTKIQVKKPIKKTTKKELNKKFKKPSKKFAEKTKG